MLLPLIASVGFLNVLYTDTAAQSTFTPEQVTPFTVKQAR